jgi:hypothetical protein
LNDEDGVLLDTGPVPSSVVDAASLLFLANTTEEVGFDEAAGGLYPPLMFRDLRAMTLIPNLLYDVAQIEIVPYIDVCRQECCR